MIQHGVQPVERRKTNFSYPRTFGTVSSSALPTEYNCDAGFGFPNQNADGYPNGCTGYTQSELCQDEDQVLYKPSYTYEKTLEIGGLKNGEPCSIYDSLKSTIVYGVQRDTETTDEQAYTHKRGQYYQVERTAGLDWFDATRSTLWLNRLARRSVSMCTPWYPEFSSKYANVPDTSRGGFDVFSGHNWKVSGWKTIDGVPYLIAKTWQGKTDPMYFSREAINKLMTVRGTAAFTIAQYDGTINTVRLGLIYSIQVQLAFLRRKLLGV